jgi:hypothetical protein
LLEAEIRKLGLRSRTFISIITIRAAKWITAQEVAAP